MSTSKDKLKALADQNLKSHPGSGKKIIPGKTSDSLREQFKKTFLPLLIEVSQLRITLEGYRLEKVSGRLIKTGEMGRSPKEILGHLKQLQHDVIETRRWCEGIIGQIERGIDETKELLQFLGEDL